MTVNSLNTRVQSTQHGSSSAHSGIPADNRSELLNTRQVCHEQTSTGFGFTGMFTGMFSALKEYFWPTPLQILSIPAHENHALTDRTIDVESALDFDSGQDGQNHSYTSTIKRIALVAAAAGIATAVYQVSSTFNTRGDVLEQNFASSDALSATLTATALIGRRLLSAPTVTNAIANQSVFANAPFNLTIDISKVFSYTGSLKDIHCSQVDGTPLPSWLTMTIIPSLIGSIAANGATHFAVVDNYAYMADNTAGLKIIDVSNKENPALVGSIMTSYAEGVAVVGNYAYVTEFDSGLKIIDVSSKTSPVLIGSIAIEEAFGVDVVDNYAYVASQCYGLQIIDISNKANPVKIRCVATMDVAYGVEVVGNYAYIAALQAGLKIIDVTNKAGSALIGSIATSSARGLAVVDNYTYVADYDRGLKIIDVSNKANPALVGSIATTNAVAVAVVDNYAYVADQCGGLKIIDISNKASPALIGSKATYSAQDITVVDYYVYVADATDGLMIFSSNKISLSGTPAPLNRGSMPIQLTITDALGEIASTYFWITVLNNPPIAPAIEPQTVHHAFDWIIPPFSDIDGDALTYSATLADGSPLPDWVSFNSTTRHLSGAVPPVVIVRNVTIQANDTHGGIGNGMQTIYVVNAAPIVGTSALPDQYVKPTIPFNFLLAPNVFVDPDEDPLTYSASLANQQPLPEWLTFNQTLTGGIFAGTAPAGYTGSMSVIVAATDPFGAAISRSFDLNVAGSSNSNTPPVKLTNPPDCAVGVDRQISFQISNNTFFDADHDPLTYSASTVNGSALPDWLSFDGDTRFFYGTAPNTAQILPINVQAEDWQHIPATANFNLFIEGTPQLLAPLSNLVAIVGTPFRFVVPDNTFQNFGFHEAMTWSAVLTTGAPLPTWLTFDPGTRTFYGTPGRKDTDAFSSRPLPVRLIADNSIGTASVDFIINVKGESDATFAMKIISGVGGTFAIIGMSCVVWKKSMKCINRLPTEKIVFGRESEYCHTITRINPENPISVQLLRDGHSLPTEMLLPDWLIYDNSSARLTIDATKLKEQEGLISSRWTVQIKNKGGCVNHLVWEEFDIMFVTQLEGVSAEDEWHDNSRGIVMGKPKTRREQLRQPLIVAQQ